MGICLALVSQKGGVGKTTLSANLAAAFADLRFRTLLVEVDPQGSLIQCFGLDRFDLHEGLFGCVTSESPPRSGVETKLADNLDLLPANVWSHEEEGLYLERLSERPGLLRDLLGSALTRYDYLVLDCPPALGPLTRAALAAADRYLVPIQAESMNLSNLSRLERLAGEVRTDLNPELVREGYVVTMADTRTRHANTIIEKLSREFPRDLLQTIIPRSIRIAEDVSRGRPTVNAGKSRAGAAFQSLAEEILSRHSRERAGREAEENPRVPADDEADWDRVLDEADRRDAGERVTVPRNGAYAGSGDSWDLD